LLQAAMLIWQRIDKPMRQIIENAIYFRQYSLFCGIAGIPVVDIGSPGHSGEAKTGCLDLQAKNLSCMKSNCMA